MPFFSTQSDSTTWFLPRDNPSPTSESWPALTIHTGGMLFACTTGKGRADDRPRPTWKKTSGSPVVGGHMASRFGMVRGKSFIYAVLSGFFAFPAAAQEVVTGFEGGPSSGLGFISPI